MIDVQKVSDRQFEVTVDGETTTEHTVTLDPDYYQKLTGGDVSRKHLIEKSFEFLLDREPNTSIMRQFDLPTITSFFPEYEDEIQKELAG